MTEAQRIERARQATLALETFLDPAFAVVIEEYHARLQAVCAKEPWASDKISALANASRIVSEVRAQITGLVHDGEEAKSKLARAEKIESLSPARRRLLNIGPF